MHIPSCTSHCVHDEGLASRSERPLQAPSSSPPVRIANVGCAVLNAVSRTVNHGEGLAALPWAPTPGLSVCNCRRGQQRVGAGIALRLQTAEAKARKHSRSAPDLLTQALASLFHSLQGNCNLGSPRRASGGQHTSRAHTCQQGSTWDSRTRGPPRLTSCSMALSAPRENSCPGPPAIRRSWSRMWLKSSCLSVTAKSACRRGCKI